MEGLDTNEFESLDQHIQAIYPDCEGSSLRVRNLILDTFARACRRLLRGTRFQRLNLVNSVYSVYLRARVNRIATGVGTVTVLFRQLQIEVDASDITIVPTLLDGSYERRELDRFEDVAPHLRTFVDVGCNVGIYSIAALKANPKLHVLAFDPGEASRQILARNLQRNGISDGIRFELVSKAVSNEVGSRPWIVTGFSGTSHLANPDVRGEVAQIVNMTTLDDELLPRGGVKVRCSSRLTWKGGNRR